MFLWSQSRRLLKSPVLYDLHWLCVPQRIDQKILIPSFKSFNGKAPFYLKDLLIKDDKDRDLRSNDWILLGCPIPDKTHYGECSFAYTAPLLWNKQPLQTRTYQSLNSFKSIERGIITLAERMCLQ